MQIPSLKNNYNNFLSKNKVGKFTKEEYFQLIKNQEEDFFYGQKSIKNPLKLNQSFVLYIYTWNKNRVFLINDIPNIDSILDTELSSKNQNDPLLFNFEKALWSINDSNEYITTESEYKLYTYFNETKYYITVDSKNKNLTLSSEENRDIIKSKLINLIFVKSKNSL